LTSHFSVFYHVTVNHRCTSMASEQSKKCYLFDNERSQKPKNSTLYIHENLSFDICTAICALQNKATEREIMTYK